MKFYLAIPLVLLAMLITASGIAAVSRGWVPSWNRRRVRAPRVYGWGQLVVALALCWQLVFELAVSDDAQPAGTLIGSAILVAGLVVMLVSQLTGDSRKGDGTPEDRRIRRR